MSGRLDDGDNGGTDYSSWHIHRHYDPRPLHMGFQPHVISSREFVENPDMKLLTSVPHDATVSTMAESKTPSLSEVSEIPENAVCKATSKGSEHQEPPEGLQDANERHQLPVKSDEQSVILQPEESFQVSLGEKFPLLYRRGGPFCL